MQLAKVFVSDNRAAASDKQCITSGLIGATVAFEFDETWADMDTVAMIWRGAGKAVLDTTASGVVPAEVLAKANGHLLVGVYGTKGDTATPTIWVDLGVIQAGADPSGDESADPSLPVWAQIQKEIAKLKEQSGGEIGSTEVQRIVEKYLQDNPPAPGPQGPKGDKGDKGDTGAPGADGYTPVKGKDYYTEADKQEMVNAVLAALPAAEGVSY